MQAGILSIAGLRSLPLKTSKIFKRPMHNILDYKISLPSHSKVTMDKQVGTVVNQKWSNKFMYGCPMFSYAMYFA